MSVTVTASSGVNASESVRHPPAHCVPASEKVLEHLRKQYGVERKDISVATGVVLGLWVGKRFVPGHVVKEGVLLGYFRSVEVDKLDPQHPDEMRRSWFRYENGLVEVRENDRSELPPVAKLELARKKNWPPRNWRTMVVSDDARKLERHMYYFGVKRLVVTTRPGGFPVCVED